MPMPWFSTRGQVVQTIVPILALLIPAIVAWPKLREDQLLAVGPIIFYLLVGAGIVTVVIFVRTANRTSRDQREDGVAIVSPRDNDTVGPTDTVRGTIRPVADVQVWIRSHGDSKWYPAWDQQRVGEQWSAILPFRVTKGAYR